MLIHGSKDRRVPEINAEALADKLAKVNQPASLPTIFASRPRCL